MVAHLDFRSFFTLKGKRPLVHYTEGFMVTSMVCFLVEFMLFGTGADDTRSHLVGDDETAASITLPIPIPFYQQKERQIYVSWSTDHRPMGGKEVSQF